MTPQETYFDLIEDILDDISCVSQVGSDEDSMKLIAFAQELAEGVTAERDAEIAEALPVPYQKRVPARAQIDGDELTIPRCVIAQASRARGGEWNTSTRGPRMGRMKAGCAVGVHVELDIPGVVEIVRVVVLWRRGR